MDSFSLEISYPTNSIPTRYSDNNQDSNSVIDLMFLRYGSEKLDNHIIHSDWWLFSNHTPLTVTIPIVEEHIHNKKHLLIKDSVEEKSFIKDLIKDIKTINTSNLTNIDSLENFINSFAKAIEKTWEKNSKIVNITRHSKSWWDLNCSRDLEKYKSTRRLEDWKQFKKMVKITKHSFFNQKIQEILDKKREF